MSTFKHILVPTDFSECAEQALEIAISLSKKLDAKLTLLHVCEVPVASYAMYAEGLSFPLDDLEASAQKALDAVAKIVKAQVGRLDVVLRNGDAVDQILATCNEQTADVVVMGTRGRRGVSRFLLGSVAEKMVRVAHVPVLTVPARLH